MTLYPSSISARLTVGLGLIAVMVFSTTGLLLQQSLAKELKNAARDELKGKVGVVRHFIDEYARANDLPALRHHLDDMLIGHKGLSIRIRSSDTIDVYRGAGLPVAAVSDVQGFGLARNKNGTDFETLRAPLGPDSPWPGGAIELGLNTQPREELLRRHRNALVGIGALGLALTVTLGAVATWRGLAPVKRLSRQAGRITAHSRDIRLTDPHDAAELDGLVKSFNAGLDRLDAAYRQMEAFSANVAHELRTPLATLISGSQLMLLEPRSVSELKELVGSNLEELQQMSQLVNDMLFLARADQGDRANGLAITDLAAEADRTLRYCEPLLDDAGLTATRIGSASFRCNTALIQRALVNLIVNAVQHTERGLSIVVRIEREGATVRISVENPAPSIPETTRVRMFDRFFRGDDARSWAGESHGLGLTIVAAVARMHGGTVFTDRAGDHNRVGLAVPGAQPGDEVR